MTTQPIRFFHRGKIVAITDAAPTRTVLDWLREDARCTGTKEGCNEGDCGACTVLIGELPDSSAGVSHPTTIRGLNLHSVNACIQFLPTLHGKALFTVEDLQTIAAPRQPEPAADPNVIMLHPVQQAMVDCHASQCGFCTPGFVMSLFGSYEQHRERGDRPTRQQLADELSGNLCRCTGYRTILDAGQRMFDLPPTALATAPVIAALQKIEASAGLDYRSEGATGTEAFFAPRSLAELATLREAKPKATLLAGSTDIGLWVNKLFKPLGELIYLGDVAELKTIADDGGTLRIGAGASLEAAWQALARRFPALTDVWLRFASPPIRNAGTMGGNVANGSPIGDSAPVLMALSSSLVLRHGKNRRTMVLDDFYLDYMKNALVPGEFVEAIEVPTASLLSSGGQVRAYKISKRFDCDISAVCAGFWLRLEGETVAEIRLVFGGMAAVVKRAAGAEAALLGKPWTQASIDVAKTALAADFKPLTDMRASADYRSKVVQNLLQRFWLETRLDAPLDESQTSVWSVMPHDALQG